MSVLKLTNPEQSKLYEEFFFKNKELDEALMRKFDMSEVKLYPGSDKGPLPEDDPQYYSKWFIENQPKKSFEGMTTDFSEFGIK